MTGDTSTLISLVIAASGGAAGHEAEIVRLAGQLKQRFAFFEIVLLSADKDEAALSLIERLVTVAPQARLLVVDGAPGYDDLAVYGYQECIGDIVIMASVEELALFDLDRLVAPILAGANLVRMKRPSNTYLGWASSRLVRIITGFRVDTRFYRTLALNRQLLTELLAAPERLVLFRFTSRTWSQSKVLVIDGPVPRGSFRSGLRRLDLAARLVATAAPRLLRYTALVCALGAFAGFLTLIYAAAIWLFKSDVIEGWTSMTSLIAVWMFVQLSAASVLCLGLSRLLDREARPRGSGRLVHDLNVGDLFAKADLLNVEFGTVPASNPAAPPRHASGNQERSA